MAGASPRDITIMRGAYSKLDNMPLSFGIPRYSDSMTDADVEMYMYGNLKDTMRELNIKSCDVIGEMTIEELRIENRVVYHALRKFRNSASVFFKFSTSTDGKSVDKQMIPKMLLNMITEYDQEFRAWRRTLTSGTVWRLESDILVNGDYSTSS